MEKPGDREKEGKSDWILGLYGFSGKRDNPVAMPFSQRLGAHHVDGVIVIKTEINSIILYRYP
jgi:hypothetical protein